MWAVTRTSSAGRCRSSSGIWAKEQFIRIHRSIIVNLDRIQGLELQSGGEYEVVLKSKVRLRLSRRFRKRLQERLR